ncbi:bifunctional folylpolyglutamate synthase/dihydrofolate synthase [Camelimonas fluminis]|uniref:Dihydrofolate synthase/folylpolyglutamate synthase n=1 Tax=Camelimonas fluminis TaxID=1576911 RepID=A0ABV7UP92_9HYPH|nr:folylpolyglutamate synthase/dihydrofolate synthase family protein [Camelimonas fluminis]GHE69120.1 bifunctional folylpolyglutamate synthase/dihydrofolate synthase [Camelimonas fluminis]
MSQGQTGGDTSDALIARFLGLHPKAIDLSLDRIRHLLTALGSPEKRLPPVIHVAGTNGKGSTIAFMRAILEAAGLAVHVYTSPHLVRFHERIRLGRRGGPGVFVDEDVLVEALRACEQVNAGQPITVFEITTAAALKLFSEHPADVLLLEVGLGGRYDATNVIDAPVAAIVTPVSQDHAEFLGTDVLAIAREKAGVFKADCPAIIAAQPRDVSRELEEAALRVGAIPFVGGQDFQAREENGRLIYEDINGLLDLPLPRLGGRHQHVNAGAAIAALRAAGMTNLSDAAIERGLLGAEWPARMQRLRDGRLLSLAPAGAEIWLDGGHNPDGGRAIAAALADLEERSPAPLVMIVGMLGTKDGEGFLAPFAGLARDVIAVPIPGQMAARTAAEVAQMALAAGMRAETATSVEAALIATGRRVWARPPRILIAGSLYLAGEVLAANGTPPV